MTTKMCKKCKQEKPMSDYSKGQGKCKTCRKHLRTEQYDDKQKEQRKQHYKEVERPIAEKKKATTKEELRAEFKTKHNMKPDEDMLHRYFDTDYGEHEHIFITEETFEKLMKDLNEKNPDKEPTAVKPPQQIYDMIAEREKEDMK